MLVAAALAAASTPPSRTPPRTLAQVPGVVRIHLGTRPDWVALTPGAVWSTQSRPDLLDRIDTGSNRVDARVPLPGPACAGIATGLGSVWVPICGRNPAIVRVDPTRARILAILPVDAVLPESAIAVGADSLWAPLGGTGTLARLDPETGRVRQRVRVPVGTAVPVYADGRIWATSPARATLTVIDDASGRITARIATAASPRFAAVGAGSVWLLTQRDGTVERIDMRALRRTSRIAAHAAGHGGDIAFGEGRVWTSVPGKPLAAIDPARAVVDRTWTGPGGDALRAGGGVVWLTDAAHGDLLRLPVPALLAH